MITRNRFALMVSLLICPLPVFVIAQSSSVIYLLDMSSGKSEITLSNPRVITNHKGYNNQPFFHSKLPLLYYASFDDSGRSDIKTYDYKSKSTQNLTSTPESEYSPALTPDEQFISCVIARSNGQQDLGKYPVNGGEPVVLINNLKIGYYGWTGSSTLLLFVLNGSSFDMHYYNLATRQDSLLSMKPGRCFVKVPGEDAMSFIDKTDTTKLFIKKMNTLTGKIETITMAPGLSEDFTWTKNGLLIMSKEGQLFFYDPKQHPGKWQQLPITAGSLNVKKITRLAVNAENNLLAIVGDE